MSHVYIKIDIALLSTRLSSGGGTFTAAGVEQWLLDRGLVKQDGKWYCEPGHLRHFKPGEILEAEAELLQFSETAQMIESLHKTRSQT